MMSRGLAGVVVTGSAFEQDEGAGDAPLRAFSPYGLSKGLTWQYYRFLSETMNFNLGKFVIANPFGPFEEPRFCSYLIRSWFKGEVPAVRTPLYVRDNIHVDLLAATYAAFAEKVPSQRGVTKFNPSFYVESQGAFAHRFAGEMSSRLGLPARSFCNSSRISPSRWSGSTPIGSTAPLWLSETASLGRRSRIL